MTQTIPAETLSTRDRSVIATLLVAAFTVILNETTLNVALTPIMDDLRVGERTAQWLTTAFMLTMAVVIPVTGWLLQRFRTRTVFVLAMTLFSAGTLVCALAPGFAIVLAGRVVQASGTAIMMPLLMTTVMQLVPADRRGSVMGTISLVISVAPAMGPTLAGLVLRFTSWRGIFWLVLPIALVVLAIGGTRIANVNEPGDAPMDPVSVLLSALGFGGLVYALSLIGGDSNPGVVCGVVVAGAACLALFVWRQLRLARAERALLDLSAFGILAFRIATIVMAIAMMALFGTIIMLPLVLQRALGMEPLTVGLLMLPGGLAMGLLGPVVGRLYDRVGPRPLVIPASVVVGVVFFLLGTLGSTTPWWFVMVCHVAMSAAFACLFTPMFTISMGSLPPHLYSHGSAIVGTVQQLAGAIGTAVFVTLFSTITARTASGGATEAESLLTGARWAFRATDALWLGVIGLTFVVRAPAHATRAPAHH